MTIQMPRRKTTPCRVNTFGWCVSRKCPPRNDPAFFCSNDHASRRKQNVEWSCCAVEALSVDWTCGLNVQILHIA